MIRLEEVSSASSAAAGAIPWTDWSPAAFERARREGKLVFLWIGAGWAAAARAMEAGALADRDVAELLGREFVAIKIDSDERPDVNDRYNLGGWPTTAILTDGGEVLTGGTSFRSDELTAMLRRAVDAMSVQGDAIRARAEEAVQVRRTRSLARRDRCGVDLAAVSWFRNRAVAAFDRDYGGFDSDGRKFPHAPVLQFLLRHGQTTSDADAAETLTATLDAMADGALRDAEHGGFFRYADTGWTTACPDKTLEDNAALLSVYARAAQTLSRRDYVDVVRETLTFVRGAIEAASAPTDATADALIGYLEAAQLLGDTPGRDFALAALDQLVLDVYRPAHGVAHMRGRTCASLLTDHVHVAAAALAAHEVTDSPVYSMLAEELMRYALRTMWDDESSAFVDRAEQGADLCARLSEPLRPLADNCAAASVMCRLAALSDRDDLRGVARKVLGSFAASYRDDDLLAAPYALAMLDCVHLEELRAR